jgi:SNF2 family DNA or RNA helicase
MCCKPSGETVLRFFVPRQKVKRLLAAFKELLPNQHQLPIHPIPLKSIFKVNMNTKLDLEIRPLIQLIQDDGEAKFFKREDLERFRYGDLIYVPELGILAELEKPGTVQRKFKAPVKMVLKKSQIPSFLEEFGDELREGAHLMDAKVEGLQIFTQVDRLEITPETLERDWCWLSAAYGFGNSTVSLAEVLRAKEENQRFIGTPEGWVDCQSPALEGLDYLMREADFEMPGTDGDLLKLSRLDLLRIQTSGGQTIQIKGRSKEGRLLKRILDLKPAGKLPPLKGMTSTLRRYQEHGLAWIWFLFENGFGGLLCDDMGLGKTHQVMAFMLGRHEQEKTAKPFLVVCPTTVLSHWTRKIREHVPALKATFYYGGQRDLAVAIKESQVLLTSYGILRRDIDALKQIEFQLAVFDEIQHIKNPDTLAHDAALKINAGMKLGLTGTPIENTPDELKALFDLTVPGYLGTDADFASRYTNPIAENPQSDAPKRLARLISPFTLRRLKKTVLTELPKKIEDIRTCRLSEDQVKLYRDAISSRGRHLLEELRSDDKPVPFMHIFALLNLLKQICNHPALVKGEVEDYDRHRSGKWDLFAELMVESLDSGQKVVVYSQFLGMIEIMKRLLSDMRVGFVTLTGKSRNRGKLIDRFNDDPDCRVYVGSLKAGGAGVDLVAGSVVIHYDRWWNAAKEDQATDRVHRIGQRRGVQVFKLVTEGTLEEKISAIIEKKRNLMDKIVKEDDPGLMKRFSREEIIEMLAHPD